MIKRSKKFKNIFKSKIKDKKLSAKDILDLIKKTAIQISMNQLMYH